MEGVVTVVFAVALEVGGGRVEEQQVDLVEAAGDGLVHQQRRLGRVLGQYTPLTDSLANDMEMADLLDELTYRLLADADSRAQARV